MWFAIAFMFTISKFLIFILVIDLWTV